MSRSDRGAALVLAGAALLAGCASAPRLPAPAGQLEYTGRFSVSWRTDSLDNPVQRSTGRFALRVDGPRSELEVSSPLGQTLALATVAPGKATLATAGGARFDAPDAQGLTERAFGWPAPLAQLPRWLAGTPGSPSAAPGGASAPADTATTEPVRFIEANWQVSVDAWQGGVPRRLVLRWPATAPTDTAPAAAGDASRPVAREVELRLVVDDVPAAP